MKDSIKSDDAVTMGLCSIDGISPATYWHQAPLSGTRWITSQRKAYLSLKSQHPGLIRPEDNPGPHQKLLSIPEHLNNLNFYFTFPFVCYKLIRKAFYVTSIT